MQVNVKELTGVLHLNLVFMIVLVLQSFLAVSSQVYCVNHSKLQASPSFSSVTSILQVWLCQLFQAPSISKCNSPPKYFMCVTPLP